MIIEKIQADLKQALKTGEKEKVNALRYLLSLIKNKALESSLPLNDEAVLAVLQKEMKLKKEALEAFKKGQRQDLADQEEKEIGVLAAYLPEMLSEEEIEEAVKEIIAKQGTSDFGKTMREAMIEFKGKAEGAMVSSVVKKLLS